MFGKNSKEQFSEIDAIRTLNPQQEALIGNTDLSPEAQEKIKEAFAGSKTIYEQVHTIEIAVDIQSALETAEARAQLEELIIDPKERERTQQILEGIRQVGKEGRDYLQCKIADNLLETGRVQARNIRARETGIAKPPQEAISQSQKRGIRRFLPFLK